jgi:hypothetical protein
LAGAQIDLTKQPMVRKAQYQPFPAVSRQLRPYPTACAEGSDGRFFASVAAELSGQQQQQIS